MAARWIMTLMAVVWAGLWLTLPARAAEDGPLGEAVATWRDAPATVQPLYTGCTVVVFAPTNWDFEQQVVERVNDHRASIGRPPLKRVTVLDEVARYHSRDMRDDDYFNHKTYDRVNGALTLVCDTFVRIGNYYTNALNMAENIAAGYNSPASVMAGWLDSAGHRANIESPNYWEIGVGYEAGGTYWHYWTQDFGRRANTYPLVIQREYSRTATPNVTVYIYGVWQQMRLRNDSGPWGAWQPFTNTLNWQLNWTQGTRQVCAELQSGSQTVTSCDTIELTTSAPPPVLSAQPAQTSFVYVLSTGQRFPQTALLSLTNSASSQTLTWQVGSAPAWLTVTPASGSTPDSNVQLALDTPQVPGTPGLYTGVVQFNATNASASATVNVSLRVVNSLPYRRSIPLVRR